MRTLACRRRGGSRGVARSPVIADASLYARRELASSLASTGEAVSPDDSAAALIVAVYRARGSSALLSLNGDYAFILWDADRQTLLLGRDFVGTRALYYGVLGGRFVVSTTLAGVLALSCDAPPSFDRLGLAEAASGLSDGSGRTCYVGVRALQPGRVISVGPSLEPREVARWGGANVPKRRRQSRLRMRLTSCARSLVSRWPTAWRRT